MKFKFEYVLAIIIVIVLSAALFGAFYLKEMELINTIVTVFIAALSSITAFFFTKHKPDKTDDEQ